MKRRPRRNHTPAFKAKSTASALDRPCPVHLAVSSLPSHSRCHEHRQARVAIIRRSCSDSPVTASQMDGVFGTDRSGRQTRETGRQCGTKEERAANITAMVNRLHGRARLRLTDGIRDG
jgi:hypothetical protein